ncbi:MAG: GntR family transcriptional regulator [Cyclobacteriaceae bacterium]|jgi:DNA-binding transcriptional regulator YhcF (GntR family)|nr:GntR family transcriptional regulator [Cyclobacteriaceae bacterium]
MIKEYPIIDEINIDNLSATPKYMQVAKAILKAVYEERIKKNETLPSINELSFSLDISRDTVEKSYRHLKQRGIIGSVPGKGFFVKSNEMHKRYKVLLLLNKLSEHKKVMYDALLETFDGNAEVDIYVYNNDFTTFKKIILNRLEDYSHFVVTALFSGRAEDAGEVMSLIPRDKLIVVDKLVPGLPDCYAAVYENFESDIYNALTRMLDRVSSYQRLKVIFPDSSYYPPEIIRGIRKFAADHRFRLVVTPTLERAGVDQGDLVITVRDKDLMALVDYIMNTELKPGKDVGIISYNESPCKKYILGGIATVSTNFRFIGEQAARLIMEGAREQVAAPFEIHVRASL